MSRLARFLLPLILLLPLGAAAQLAVVLSPNPAAEDQRIRARITGNQPPGFTQAPTVRMEPGVISIFLGRECGFLCPPPSEAVDYDVALPLLSPGVYQVYVYAGPAAAAGTLQGSATLVVRAGAGSAAICVTGLWWSSPANSESGWGLSLDHQGDVIFAVWFTYDSDGKATWFTVPGARHTSTVGTYAGPVYRNSGPPWHAPWDNSAVKGTQVGEATLAFSSESFGVFTYTIDGKSGTKYITRQVFSTPVSRCSFL